MLSNQICWPQIRKTRLISCFWKVIYHFNWFKFFCFLYSTKLPQNNLLIFISSKSWSRTLLGTKIDFYCDNNLWLPLANICHNEFYPRCCRYSRSVSVKITVRHTLIQSKPVFPPSFASSVLKLCKVAQKRRNVETLIWLLFGLNQAFL